MRLWIRVWVAVGCLLALFGLLFKFALNMGPISFVFWFLELPSLYSKILGHAINFGLLFGSLLIGLLLYTVLKGKEEIKL